MYLNLDNIPKWDKNRYLKYEKIKNYSMKMFFFKHYLKILSQLWYIDCMKPFVC